MLLRSFKGAGHTDPQNNVTTYQYDSRGNRTALIDALTNQTSFGYKLPACAWGKGPGPEASPNGVFTPFGPTSFFPKNIFPNVR